MRFSILGEEIRMDMNKGKKSPRALTLILNSICQKKFLKLILTFSILILCVSPALAGVRPDSSSGRLGIFQNTKGMVVVTVYKIDYFDNQTNHPAPGVTVRIGKEEKSSDSSGKTGFFEKPMPGYTYTAYIEETERYGRTRTSFTIPLNHPPGEPFPVVLYVKDKTLPKLIVVDKNQRDARSFRNLRPGEIRILDAYVGEYTKKVTDQAEWRVSPESVVSLEPTSDGIKLTVVEMPAAGECLIQVSFVTQKGDQLKGQSRVSVRVPPPPSPVEKVIETPQITKKEVRQDIVTKKTPVPLNPPEVEIPYNIIEGQRVTLNIKNYSPSLLYTWSIKKIVNGTPKILEKGQEPSLSRSFEAGNYEFEVKVTDSEHLNSKSVIERFSVRALEVKPEPKPEQPSRVDQMIEGYGNLALFDVSPSEVEIDEQVEFRVKAQFDKETTEEFTFDWFIDGQPIITSGKRLSISTTFPKPGEYTIDLRIQHTGLQKTWTHSERIKIIPKPLPTENPAEFTGPARGEMGQSAAFSVNYFISYLKYICLINPPEGSPFQILDQRFILPITEERFKLGPNTIRIQVTDPSSKKTYTFERTFQVEAKPAAKPAPVMPAEPQPPVEINLAEFSGPELVQRGNVGKFSVLHPPKPPHQYYHVFLNGKQTYKKMTREVFSVHFREVGLYVIELNFVDEQAGKSFTFTKRVQVVNPPS